MPQLLTRWQKFHSFYQKKQLFSTIANDADNNKVDDYKLAAINIKSYFYQTKLTAFGRRLCCGGSPSKDNEGGKRKCSDITELADLNGDNLNKAFINEDNNREDEDYSEEEWYSGNSCDTYNMEAI
jgi:hypothetical protein